MLSHKSQTLTELNQIKKEIELLEQTAEEADEDDLFVVVMKICLYFYLYNC